jgi:hypothetical protein
VSAYREPAAPLCSGVTSAARIPEEHGWQPAALSPGEALALDAKIAAFDTLVARARWLPCEPDGAMPFWYDVANERSYRLPQQLATLETELARLLRVREIGMSLDEYLARRRDRESGARPRFGRRVAR